MMIRWILCLFLISVLALWILSISVLSLATAIRDDLGVITLVTENTSIGDFYLKEFFPVIFPIVITVSCFIFVIGFIGYCGVFTNSQALLGWFFFSLLITFCVELSAGVWKMIKFDLTYNQTDVTQLKKNIGYYTGGADIPSWFEEAWAEIHERFDCCGAILYTDWFTETHTQHIIHTCCPERECTIFTLPSRGCGNDLLSYASSSKYIQIMPYLTCITGIVQVLSMVLTLKIWLGFCAKTNEQARESQVQKITHEANHHKESLYQIEMDERNGRSGYLAPLLNTKNNRFYKSRSTQNGSGTTPQYFFPVNHMVLPEADKEGSENVTEEASHTISEDSNKNTKANKNSITGSVKDGISQSSRNQTYNSFSSCRTNSSDRPSSRCITPEKRKKTSMIP